MRTSFDADSTITDAAEAADSRRSIRRYDSARIPEADLRELLRLAGRAPSAFNAQPWRFVVVQDAELKSRLSAAAYGQQQIVRAPATIVMYSDMRDALQRMPESMHPDMPQEKRDARRELPRHIHESVGGGARKLGRRPGQYRVGLSAAAR